MGNTKEGTKSLEEILAESGISSSTQQESKLVLWNDDENSFEWVILCLNKLMGFSLEKAEQTAYTVHLTGKDIIKTGSVDELMPYKKLLQERGLTVSIEEY
jgi:ATP-dependent Clp protease adaptor protein ClpS